MNRLIVFLFLFFIILFMGYSIEEIDDIANSYEKSSLVSTTILQDTKFPIFVAQEIPDSIYENMLGNSIPFAYQSQVDRNSLSYLQLSYIDFNGESQIGEMIVCEELTNEVIQIFQELYEIKYPIEKMKLIDEYHADDELSMSDNNTSCFCYRVIAGTSSLSKHAYRLFY